jgi:hypothetical protein
MSRCEADWIFCPFRRHALVMYLYLTCARTTPFPQRQSTRGQGLCLLQVLHCKESLSGLEGPLLTVSVAPPSKRGIAPLGVRPKENLIRNLSDTLPWRLWEWKEKERGMVTILGLSCIWPLDLTLSSVGISNLPPVMGSLFVTSQSASVPEPTSAFPPLAGGCNVSTLSSLGGTAWFSALVPSVDYS